MNVHIGSFVQAAGPGAAGEHGRVSREGPMVAPPAALQAQDVGLRYRSQTVLHHVNLTVPEGAVVVLRRLPLVLATARVTPLVRLLR